MATAALASGADLDGDRALSSSEIGPFARAACLLLRASALSGVRLASAARALTLPAAAGFPPSGFPPSEFARSVRRPSAAEEAALGVMGGGMLAAAKGAVGAEGAARAAVGAEAAAALGSAYLYLLALRRHETGKDEL